MATGLLKNVCRIVVVAVAVSLALAAAGTAALASVQNPGFRACEEGSRSNTKFKDAACDEVLSTGHFEELTFEKTEEGRALFWEAAGTEKLGIGHGATIACKGLAVGKGSEIVGGHPGKAELTIEYSGCEVSGQPKCTIDGREGGKALIATNALDAQLVYLSKKTAETHSAEDTGMLFQPASGEVLVAVALGGAECALKGEYSLTGRVLGENVEATTRSRHHLVKAPEKPIDTYWINTAEGTVEHHVKLTVGGAETFIILEGAILILERTTTTHMFCWILIFSE